MAASLLENLPASTEEASKVKRSQLQAQFGVHLASRERQYSPIRMAGAGAPEQVYRLDTAVVWSSGFAPDQGYMRPGAFQPYGVKSGSFYVNPEHLDDLELAGTGDLYRRGGEIPIASVGGHTIPGAGQVVGDRHEFYAELDEGYAQEDVDRIVYRFENYDPDRPTALEAENQRASQARAR